ncbi:MAG: DNA-protecting protein DprA [Alphaproteobacteria bacterium]|nr:DNA-protecting protein DprA [Alphaproteobacteria bacterium]
MTKPPAFTAPERLARLRLIRTERIGPIVFRRLIATFGSGQAALDAVPGLARRGGERRPLRLYAREEAEREIVAAETLGAHLVFIGESTYPPLLAEIADPPPALYLRGRCDILARPMVSVVGARNASAAGRKTAGDIAGGLCTAGFVVASGLARGIDAAVHAAALASGTVAVVAGGVDVVYPQENRGLFDAILAQGAIIGEQPPGTVPQATHFPRRNRIISGLARGVVVIEAAFGSGSLITARFAAEQGREVFAVPGSPLDPRARGTNDLIRHGATLTESAADVVAGLEGWSAPRPESGTVADDPPPATVDDGEIDRARQEIQGLLGPTPIEVDEILRQCQVTPALARIVLLEFELADRLERHPGDKVALAFTNR